MNSTDTAAGPLAPVIVFHGTGPRVRMSGIRLAITLGAARRWAKDAYLAVPDALDLLARSAAIAESPAQAVRLFAAADAMRGRQGAVRFKIFDDEYRPVLVELRESLGDSAFEVVWAEGATLTTDEAINYARRSRGERKRPSSGWASLTPTELDVARLVCDGLPNHRAPCRRISRTSTPTWAWRRGHNSRTGGVQLSSGMW